MPYYTTTAAQFDPYSLQDLLAPLTMYKSRWDELEKSYEDMDSKAALLEAQASSDPKTAQMYSVYKEALLAGRDAMMQGLSNKDTSNLLNAKRAYNTNVLPIAEAVAARTSDSEVWRKQKASDPSLLGDDPMSKPLSGYLYGNRPDLHNVSGNALYTKAMNAAKNISSRYFNTEEGKLFKGTYYNLITEKGFPPEIAARTLIKSGQFQGLTEFYNNLLASEGVDALSQNDQIRAAEYVLSGMDAGFVRDVDMKPLQNPWVAASIKNSNSGSDSNINPSTKSILNPKGIISLHNGKDVPEDEFNQDRKWIEAVLGSNQITPTTEKMFIKGLNEYNRKYNTDYTVVKQSPHGKWNGTYKVGWKDKNGKYHYNELHPNDMDIQSYKTAAIGTVARPNATEAAYDNIGIFILKNLKASASSHIGKSGLKDEKGNDVSVKDVKDINKIIFKGVTVDKLGNVMTLVDYSTDDGKKFKEGTVIPEAVSALNVPKSIDIFDTKKGKIINITTLADYMQYIKDLDPYSPESAEALLGVSDYIYDIANSGAEGQSQTSTKVRAEISNQPIINNYEIEDEENPYYPN